MSTDSVNSRIHSARHSAFRVFSDVVTGHSYCNLKLKEFRPHLEDGDFRFVSALVYTTLDHLLYLDHVLSVFVRKQPQPAIQNILRLGTAELLFLRTPSHAVVSEYVNLCKAIGKQNVCGFVNAILRKIDCERISLPAVPENAVQRISIRYSCPEWITSMWLDTYGEAGTTALLASGSPGTTVRAQYPATSDHLEKLLPVSFRRGEWDSNALITEKGFDFTGFPAFRSGEMTIQSEGAMLICRALGDCSKKKVLDACAAPGGKSAYLASLCGNDIDLTCLELHRHRVELTEKTLGRLHVKAHVEQKNAAVPDPQYDKAFDAVLLDVPCTGFGLLHAKPDLRYEKTEADADALAELQKEILDTCSGYVRPGGILVYSTCTVSRKENEDQVLQFLKRHPDFLPDRLPFARGSMFQLLPHLHGTDGFFMARMKKCF